MSTIGVDLLNTDHSKLDCHTTLLELLLHPIKQIGHLVAEYSINDSA